MSPTNPDPRVELIARGWHIFPLIPGDKRPAVGAWEKWATTDPDRLDDWAPGAGTGIACGPSGLVVIDLDAHTNQPPPEWAARGCWDGGSVYEWLWATHDTTGRSWAETYAVETASGGGHLYYQAPATPEIRNSAGKLGWQVDVRAAGGYVVAPGTVLPTGRYEALPGVQEPAPLPGWVIDLLAPPKPAQPRTGPPTGYMWLNSASELDRRLDGLIRTIHDAQEGERNHTLNWAAYQLSKDNQLTAETAQALHQAAASIGLTEHEITATIRSAYNAQQK